MMYEELSGKILNAYFNVLKILGTGYLESVYENAMCIELDELGITKLKVGLLLNFGEGRDYKRVYLKDKVL